MSHRSCTEERWMVVDVTLLQAGCSFCRPTASKHWRNKSRCLLTVVKLVNVLVEYLCLMCDFCVAGVLHNSWLTVCQFLPCLLSHDWFSYCSFHSLDLIFLRQNNIVRKSSDILSSLEFVIKCNSVSCAYTLSILWFCCIRLQLAEHSVQCLWRLIVRQESHPE